MNPFAGVITNAYKQLQKDGIEELLRRGSLSTVCIINFPSEVIQCPNCSINPITGKSNNIYTDGPVPFEGICPYCQGEGSVNTPKSEEIDLLVVWDSKKWVNFDLRVHEPEGYVQTICRMADINKIKSCKDIVIENIHYVREGQPTPAGYDHHFIFTTWKKS